MAQFTTINDKGDPTSTINHTNTQKPPVDSVGRIVSVSTASVYLNPAARTTVAAKPSLIYLKKTDIVDDM